MELSTASVKLDSPFMRCHEREDYQRLLALLLVEMHWHPEAPTEVHLDYLPLPKDFELLYYMASQS